MKCVVRSFTVFSLYIVRELTVNLLTVVSVAFLQLKLHVFFTVQMLLKAVYRNVLKTPVRDKDKDLLKTFR